MCRENERSRRRSDERARVFFRNHTHARGGLIFGRRSRAPISFATRGLQLWLSPVGVSCDCEESAVALPKPPAPLDWPLQVSRRFVSAAAPSSGVPRCINVVWVRYMAEAHECASMLQLWRRCVKRHHLQPDSSYSSLFPNLPIHIILNSKHRRTDPPSRYPGVRLTRFRLDSFGGFARPLAPHFNDSDSAREFATIVYIRNNARLL